MAETPVGIGLGKLNRKRSEKMSTCIEIKMEMTGIKMEMSYLDPTRKTVAFLSFFPERVDFKPAYLFGHKIVTTSENVL